MATQVLPEPNTQVTLNADDLAITMDGAQVLAHLYGLDVGGGNWDRIHATGGALDVNVTAVAGAIDTELPAAVTLDDDIPNPTAPLVGAALVLYNALSGNWERAGTLGSAVAIPGSPTGHQVVGKTEGKVTYRVAFKNLVALTGVAVRLAGSASTIVRVTKVQIAKPSVAQAPLRMVKTSTAPGDGTATTPIGIPLDSANDPATAVLSLYTAAPTGGTEVGTGSVYDSDIATDDVLFETFGDEQNAQAVVLRGVAETLEIDLSADATLDGYIEWTEE